jgi:hypothetical protein
MRESVDLTEQWKLANSKTWNRYAYVENRPTTDTDPTGGLAHPNHLISLRGAPSKLRLGGGVHSSHPCRMVSAHAP